MKQSFIAALLIFIFITGAHANVLNKKGKWSAFYGYNRASYSKSDYHLTGNGYDFTLKDVVAHDSQSKVGSDPYLIPWAWSVPQNNIHFGYFVTDTLSISFGNDHMKYRMDSFQTVGFEGTIATGEGFDRSGSGTQVIDPSFLAFEHTDGLNFVSLELEHFIPLWVNAKKDSALSFLWGPGIAVMFPKTNATLFGRAQNDEFHVSGSGYSLKIGLNYDFTERFFSRLVVKHGFIDMNKARTTSSASDKLSHKFDFKETYLVFGVMF